MTDAIRSLLDRARRDVLARRIQRAAIVGCAISAVGALIGDATVGWPRSLVVLAAVPIAALVAFARRPPTEVALARALDERFATGELLATALRAGDEDVGRAVVAQAEALATRLASAAFGRPDARPLATAAVAVILAFVLSAAVAPSTRGRNADDASSDASLTGEADASRDDRSRPTTGGDAPRGEAASADASTMTAADAARDDAGRTPARGVGAASDSVRLALPPTPARATLAPVGGTVASGDGDDARGRNGVVRAGGTAGRAAIDGATSSITSSALVAQDAIDAGRVPAASRAIVRAFFDPGDATR